MGVRSCKLMFASRSKHLQKFIQNALTKRFANWRSHREPSIYHPLVLGEHPEESFSIKSTDNLLTQQLLNLSCLLKKPAYLLQISAVAMLAWSLWPTFCTSPRDRWQICVLTMIQTVLPDNDSFFGCNKIASVFVEKWFSGSCLLETLDWTVNECVSGGHASVVKDLTSSEGSMTSYEWAGRREMKFGKQRGVMLGWGLLKRRRLCLFKTFFLSSHIYFSLPPHLNSQARFLSPSQQLGWSIPDLPLHKRQTERV